MLMIMDKHDEMDRRDLDVRRALASRGAALDLVLPEFFGSLGSTRSEDDVDFEAIGEQPIEVDFDDSMTLEEAMQVFSQINVTSEDLPRGGDLP